MCWGFRERGWPLVSAPWQEPTFCCSLAGVWQLLALPQAVGSALLLWALRLGAAGGESQREQNVPGPASASKVKFGEVQRSNEMKNYFCSAEGSKIGCPLYTSKLPAVTENRLDSSIFYNSVRTSKGNVVKLEFKTGRRPISSLVELPKKKCGVFFYF